MRGVNDNIEEIVNTYISNIDFDAMVEKSVEKYLNKRKASYKLNNNIIEEIRDLCSEIYKAHDNELTLSSIIEICKYLFKKGIEYNNVGEVHLIYDSRKNLLK